MKRYGVPVSVIALLACSTLASAAIFNDATIQTHRDRQSELTGASQDILAAAEAGHRSLTTEERADVAAMTAEFDQLEEEIQLRQTVLNQSGVLGEPRGRRSDPDDTDAPAPVVVVPRNQGNLPAPAVGAGSRRVEPRARVRAAGNFGFNNFGQFAHAVRMSAIGRDHDTRLHNATLSTYGSEGTGADGGFAVPPDFAAAIAVKAFGEDSLIGRADQIRTTKNSIVMPTDMTTPWNTSGGIQAYWTGEAQTISQSKPKLEDVSTKAHKLAVLVPMTEELLEDAPAMDAYLRRKTPEIIDFKLSDAIVRGTGAGMPLGFLNADCFVTVAAESAQTADTINATNVSKMYARMPVQSLSTAVWLCHPDAQPQLDLMTIGQQPVYVPPGGFSDTPYGRLKGRPVIPHQVCETIGDLGDLMFVDLAQYLALIKVGGGRDDNGVKTDVSMHLWFDQDVGAFKVTVRVGGQPWWSTATSPRDGSSTMSPFIGLAAR